MSGCIPLTRAGLILAMGRFLELQGAPYERYLQESKMPMHLMNDASNAVPLLAGYRLAERASKKEGIEFLPFYSALNADVNDMGQYGQSLMQSRTIAQYLKRGITQLAMITTGERYWVEDRGPNVRLCHKLCSPSRPGWNLMALFGFGLTIRNFKWVLGPEWTPPEMGLPQLHPHLNFASILPGTRVVSTQCDSYMVIPKSLLAMPYRAVVQTRLPSATQLSEYPCTLPSDVVETVNQVIAMLLPYGYPALAEVAEFAGVSSRTFQRMLRRANVSYIRLVEQHRIDCACHLLETQSYSIQEIAERLAYEEAANFTRAFKRNTGVAPTTYQQNYHNAATCITRNEI